MEEKKLICMNCGRPFRVWDIHEKKVQCPFCDVKGNNPHYIKPKKIRAENMFQKFRAG